MILKKAVLILFILILFACGRQNNLIFLTESFFWEVIDRSGELARGLEKTARANNLVFDTVISDDAAALEIILQDNSNSVVILSPFMNNLAIDIAEQYTEHLFIIFGNIINTDLPSNLLTVVFDRTKIYKEAGRYIAETVQSSNLSAENNKIGIIVANISKETEAEVDAFKEGILETADESIIIEKQLSNYKDHVLIRDAIENMRSDGALYFLLKVFQSNTYCLELLKNSGGYAIVEDWAGSGGYEEQIISSIEEDYIETIGLCLGLRENIDGQIVWKTNRVNGIVKLEQ